MACIFIPKSGDAWEPRYLRDSQVVMDFIPPADKRGRQKTRRGGSPACPVLFRFKVSDRERWAVLAPDDLSLKVNGAAVPDALVMLGDRDSISWTGVRTAFFSTETLPRIVAYPGGAESVHCGRCRMPLKPGELAVKCPGCSIWHCEDAAANRGCWSYAPTCAICDQSTDREAGFQWTPAELK